MNNVYLKFSSFIYLTAFLKFAKTTNLTINLEALSLRCDCSQKFIDVACRDFRANLIEKTYLTPETFASPSMPKIEKSAYVSVSMLSDDREGIDAVNF